jgi:hypothetical protein
MKGIFLFSLVLCSSICYGQKSALTLESYKTWPEIAEGGLSNDGKFAFYHIRNYPVSKNTFILKSTSGTLIASIPDLNNPKFSNNSQYLLGLLPNDTLFIYNLQKRIENKIPRIRAYDLFTAHKQEILVLQETNEALTLSNLNGTSLMQLGVAY